MFKKCLLLIMMVFTVAIFVSCPVEPLDSGIEYYFDLSVKRGSESVSLISDVDGFLDLSTLFLQYQPVTNDLWKGKTPSATGAWYNADIKLGKNNKYYFTTRVLNSEVSWTVNVKLYSDPAMRNLVYQGSARAGSSIQLEKTNYSTANEGTINLRIFANPGTTFAYKEDFIQNANFIINDIYYRYEGDELSEKIPLEDIGKNGKFKGSLGEKGAIWKEVSFREEDYENSDYGYAWGRLRSDYYETKNMPNKNYEFLTLTDKSNYYAIKNGLNLNRADNEISNIATPITISGLPYGYHFFYISGLIGCESTYTNGTPVEDKIEDPVQFLFWEPIMVYLGEEELTVDVFLIDGGSEADRKYYVFQEDFKPVFYPSTDTNTEPVYEPLSGDFVDPLDFMLSKHLDSMVINVEPNQYVELNIRDYADCILEYEMGEEGPVINTEATEFIIKNPSVFGAVFRFNVFGADSYRWKFIAGDGEVPKTEPLGNEYAYGDLNFSHPVDYNDEGQTKVCSLRDTYQSGTALPANAILLGRGIKKGDKIIFEAEKYGRKVSSTIEFVDPDSDVVLDDSN